MKKLRMALSVIVSGFLGSASVMADGWGDVPAFSVFKQVDQAALGGGDIMGSRASVPDYPGAIGVQTLFVLSGSPEKAEAMLAGWDPTKHGSSEVIQHGEWTGAPSAGTFAPLKLASDGADGWLLEQTKKAVSGEGKLNLSQKDAQGASIGSAQDAEGFWEGQLLSKAKLYESGGLAALPPCDLGGRNFQAAAQVQRLFSKIPAVAGRFQSVTGAVLAGSPRSGYWEHSEVSRHGAVLLGAIHGAGNRLVDIQYYVSSDYWVSITFYELWPVEVKGKPATLVWRGDYVLTPAASSAQGIERLAAENLLLKEVKRAVQTLVSASGS